MMGKLKKYLIAGMLVWVPLAATFLLVRFSINLIDRTLVLIPKQYRPEELLGYEIPGLGLVLTFILMVITGAIVANFLVGNWSPFGKIFCRAYLLCGLFIQQSNRLLRHYFLMLANLFAKLC